MLIMRILLAINPTITQCLIQGLAVSDRFFARILFENAQQDAIRLAMVFRKPGPEITRRCEAHYFHHSFEAISNKVLIVFQFRVVAPTDSAFQNAVLESLVLPYPPGQ